MNFRSPLAPPSNFDPRTAGRQDLVKHGYPLPPSVRSGPLFDYNNLFSSRNIYYVPIKPVKLCKPLSIPDWSGAILTEKTYQFDSVCGSFVVPDAYPPVSSGEYGKEPIYEDGTFECFTWVGLGGYDQKQYLLIGVMSTVTSKNGKITSQDAYLRGGNEKGDFEFENFKVKPGDLVTGYVCYNYDTCDDDVLYSYVSIVNQNAKTKTSHLCKAGDPLDSAEWILEADISRAAQVIDFPDYGATFFYRTAVEYKDSNGSTHDTDASRARLVNMTAGQSEGQRFRDVVVVSYYHS